MQAPLFARLAICLLAAATAGPLYAEIHLFNRVGGGMTAGCRNPVKGATTLAAGAAKRQLPKLCGAPAEVTKHYLRFDCKKLLSTIWVVDGRKRCAQMKAAVAKQGGKSVFAFFRKGRRLWGDCAPVIGYEGLDGTILALRKGCGKPKRTDGRRYAFFHCAAHGDRQEYYFAQRKDCRRALTRARQRLAR